MPRSRLLAVLLLLAACKSRPAPAVPSPTPTPGGAVIDAELHAAAERSDEIPRARLLPMLKSRASIEATLARVPEAQRGSLTVPMQPIAGDTVLVIAIDGADAMEAVSSAHLARWKVSDAGELAALAIANLASRPSPAPAKQSNGAVLVNSGDSYDASRILVPETRLRIEEALGGAAIYAIPDRDHLLAVRADDDRAIAALREESRALFTRATHAITPDLVRYAHNRFEVVP